MERAVLFFDIDGTLLSEITREVPASAVNALTRAGDNGHLLFVNTGRTICSLPAEIVKLPFDGFLCGCGIYLTYKDQVLFERHLSVERAGEIAQMASKCRIDGIFEGVDDVYFSARTSRFDSLENTRRYMNNRGLARERYLEQGDCPFDKMFVYVDEKSRKEEFFRFISEDMDVIDRGHGTYECVIKGYSKATAMEHILKHFGISKEQSYAFGDSSNDLSMFQYAGHAVAMGAHASVLDPYTEWVTRTVEDDGIEYALKHYHLI